MKSTGTLTEAFNSILWIPSSTGRRLAPGPRRPFNSILWIHERRRGGFTLKDFHTLSFNSILWIRAPSSLWNPRSYPQYFQFHFMDSCGLWALGLGPSSTLFQFHFMDSEARDHWWSEIQAFQFHFMDSQVLYMKPNPASLLSFNSILWILLGARAVPQIRISPLSIPFYGFKKFKYNPKHTEKWPHFQFHFMDSASWVSWCVYGFCILGFMVCV